MTGRGPNLTIAINTAASQAIDVKGVKNITICGPANAPDGTLTVQVSPNGTDWFNLQRAGTDVVVTEDDATHIEGLAALFLRVLGSSNQDPAVSMPTMVY